jgi:hypothetical protein
MDQGEEFQLDRCQHHCCFPRLPFSKPLLLNLTAPIDAMLAVRLTSLKLFPQAMPATKEKWVTKQAPRPWIQLMRYIWDNYLS